MLSWLKRRKKDYDDLEDIRSNVVGDFRGIPPPPEPDFPRRQVEIEDPVARHFNEPARLERFEEPPGFSSIDVRYPERPEQRPRDDYEILDRLNLIESQLAAIRSQTETINERLKNMERQLGRRY